MLQPDPRCLPARGVWGGGKPCPPAPPQPSSPQRGGGLGPAAAPSPPGIHAAQLLPGVRREGEGAQLVPGTHVKLILKLHPAEERGG